MLYSMKFISSNNTVEYLINLINRKESGFYIRFGDGDFYLMEDKSDMLASPSKEITQSYKLLMNLLNKNDIIGVNFHCNELGTLEPGMKPGVHECPYEISQNNIQKIISYIPGITKLYSPVSFHHVMINSPHLYAKFLNTVIQNNSTIVICNREFNIDKLRFYFGNCSTILANGNNSYSERERIWLEFSEHLRNINDFTVCILALGCGGRSMSHNFIEEIKKQNKKVLIIDIGSSIDVLMGFKNTRAWVEMTNPDIDLINSLITKTTNNMSLTDIGMKYQTDKSTYHNFTDFYDSLFHFNKDKVKLLMEIGVASGSSIKMWRNYFKNALIHCYDYDINCLKTVENLPNVIFNLADQNSKESLQNAIHKNILHNSIDIIIDDGGHLSSQQRNTLNVFWPYLKSGGIYIVEDIHTNIKHWYPNTVCWSNNKYYWDESPTLFDTLTKIQLGISINNELTLAQNEIKQLILWSQPHTTSATFILIKK